MANDDKLKGRRVGRIVAGAVFVTLVATGTTVAASLLRPDAHAPPPPPRPRDLLVPERGALFGAFVARPGTPTIAWMEGGVLEIESSIGRALAIDHHFYPWSEPFPTEVERWDIAARRIPMISWHGADTVAIASGSQDELIRQRADGVRDLGAPVFVRWGWEMDGARNRSWAGTPQSYIAAWQHLRRVFDERGATNAVWVFCPDAVAFADGTAQRYYPGGGAVDWVCADGYNWAPARHGAPWEHFGSIFRPFAAWAATVRKPAMIGEFGAMERSPGEKAAWIADAFATISGSMPQVRAVVYFDTLKEDEPGGPYDWRLDSSVGALQAFASAGRDLYFASTG